MTRTRGARSNAAVPLFLRRTAERTTELLNDQVFGRFTLRLGAGMLGDGPFSWMRLIPPRPTWMTRWATPPIWPDPGPVETPEQLRDYPGALRDPEGEDRAFAERPLHDFNKMHREAVTWIMGHSWTWLLAPYPGIRRMMRRLERTRRQDPSPVRTTHSPAELSRMIRAEAKRLGISEVGFAKADSRYTLAEYDDPGDANVIVCVMEQDRAATNTAPSSRAERAAMRAYTQVNARTAPLAEFIMGLGFDARPNDWGSQEAIVIRYAVEAGLGQLGLNGQLLTPAAGSRCRLALITTSAPVELGKPVDYGIPKLCDECQICVRRCPPGAIPKVRKDKRGVVKASIKPERCMPMVAQAHGCAVCMKVCPVQRYGLDKVRDHYAETGAILGKGEDQLEGFVWPLDSRYYGPGEKPRINAEVISPPGWHFDKTRVRPVPPANAVEGAESGTARP